MAWVNNQDNAYIDHWDIELVGRRWYRKLDRDSATYLYRYEQMDPAQSVLFGPADAVGLPGGMNAAGFLITDDTGGVLYQTALTLTADLAAVVALTGQRVNAVQDGARGVADTMNGSLGQANARTEQMNDGQTPAVRNQLVRQALRFLMDATVTASNWATNTAAIIAPYRNQLLGTSARINAIATPLYQALQ